MALGFTGTRRGMTQAQIEMVAKLLRDRSTISDIEDELHHGNARGADVEAAEMAHVLGYLVVSYLPDGHRSDSYLRRNREIVDATDELIAAPAGMEEALRSGTWATVRYARKRRKLVTIVWPDGSVSHDP